MQKSYNHFRRFLTLAAAACAALLLAACGNDYPKGWASIDHGFLTSFKGHGCPDISGTYRILVRTPGERNYGLPAPLADPSLERNTEYRPETLTISGDANKELTLTFSRSPETMELWRSKLFKYKSAADEYLRTMSPEERHSPSYAGLTDAQYEAKLKAQYLWPTHQRTVRYERDYTCSGGWISTPRKIPGSSEQRNGQPVKWVENGVETVARDAEGYLVAHGEFQQSQSTSLWCGDGCKGTIPLGTWTKHTWIHWPPDKPAWAGEVPRPWAAPAPPVAVKPVIVEQVRGDAVLPKTTTTTDAITRFIDPLLPTGVRSDSVVQAGDAFKLTVRADSQARVSQLLRNIDGSTTLKTPDLIKIFKTSSGAYEAHILVFEKR